MSNFLHKVKVRTGLQSKRNKFSLSCNHVTTQDFYQNTPIYIKEMIPNESIKISVGSMSRTSPLVQPMYGSCRTVYRGFFVPFRTIMYGWNEFITDVPVQLSGGSQGLIASVPHFKWKSLYDVLTNSSYATEVSDSGYDFKRTTVSGNTPSTKSYRFTERGRLLFKILCSLGYKVNISISPFASQYDGEQYVSAMPLLAFAKIWMDWFSNPQYDTTSQIEELTKRVPVSSVELSSTDISNIAFRILDTCYASDYFTSAWDNPVAPSSLSSERTLEMHDVSIAEPDYSTLGSSFNNRVITNDSVSTSGYTRLNNGTPVIQHGAPGLNAVPAGDNGSPSMISQYILNVLHSVTDFVTRHRMVGSRALDRYMADFGIQLTSEKLNRSVYVGKFDGNFGIGDVMQTNAVEGEVSGGLGNYAGKMVGSSHGTFEYQTDEFGYFIICAYVEPLNNYVNGRPRMVHHINKFDFFNGDFDNLGTQGVRMDELSAGALETVVPQNNTNYRINGIFGFTPRFAEYKTAVDNLTGDFLCLGRNGSLDGWLLYRKYGLDKAFRDALPIKHSLAFTVADNDDYADIWQDQSNYFDHIFTVFRFDVECYAPMKPYYDMYDYSNEDGKDMLMTVNGTQVSD